MKADRETLFIQSKCGIVPGVMFDSSKEHILEAVDGILKRLDVEYLDSLLIYRPDLLVEPEEVAEAFDKLPAVIVGLLVAAASRITYDLPFSKALSLYDFSFHLYLICVFRSFL